MTTLDPPMGAQGASVSEGDGPTRTLPFFLAAFGISALALLPTILAQRGIIPGPNDRYMALAPFAVFSPTLAAMLISRFEPGGRGIRAVFRPLREWSVSPAWYVVALLLCPVLFCVAVAVYKLAGGSGDVNWFYPPRGPEQFAALFMIPLGEEIGWRGFALPRMQRRFDPLTASLLLGVGWAFWHIPMFLMAGMKFDLVFLGYMYMLIPGSVMYSWVFNRARRLLPIAIVTHIGSHLTNLGDSLASNPLPLQLYLAALTVLAVVLVVADRAVWRRNGTPAKVPTTFAD
jgi:membrane protease YdiL (CAAX protease family)